jgi:L-lactate dehydrogenase complex protein LldG
MSSRNELFAAIKSATTDTIPLQSFEFSSSNTNLLDEFIATLSSIGGKCVCVNGTTELDEHLMEQQSKSGSFLQTMEGAAGYDPSLLKELSLEVMNEIDTVCIKGSTAVAENGSIWVSEINMVHRVLPFICQNLILVISEKDIVGTMHEAYKDIDVASTDYGVFIAGPSKTADIEQSLVIGAHGPLSLVAYIIC